MIAALIIVFREIIEAGLIVGIVLAATTGVPGRERAVILDDQHSHSLMVTCPG